MYANLDTQTWVAIAGACATVFAALFAAIFPFLNSVITKKMEINAKQQAANIKRQNLEAVPSEISKSAGIENILHQITEKLGCVRCNVWLFHNGGYYYTGTGIQKISMVVDVGGPKEDKVRFHNMPLSIFARNLQRLLEANYVHERNELAYSDTLGILNQSSNVASSAIFKLHDKTNTDWVGILALGWIEHTELSSTEIKYIEQMLHSISVLISPKVLLT